MDLKEYETIMAERNKTSYKVNENLKKAQNVLAKYSLLSGYLRPNFADFVEHDKSIRYDIKMGGHFLWSTKDKAEAEQLVKDLDECLLPFNQKFEEETLKKIRELTNEQAK